jgi:hypothetical protein
VRHEQKSLVGHVHKKMAEELKQRRPVAELFRVQALCGRLGVAAVGQVRVWCTDEVRRGPARGRGCQSRVVRTGRKCRFTHGRHTGRR